MTVLSPQATPISVVFGTPTVTNGAPPVTTVCAPASGTIFQTGQTAVTCTVTDNQQRTDACAFAVTVTVPPKISATHYLAFGDSMTAGEVVSASGFSRTLRVVPDQAYPADLQKSLTGLYTTQASSITTENQGKPGEAAVDGVSRLRGILARGSYEVLTLMDGANDLGDRDLRTAQQALGAMRQMVRNGKANSLHVFLATLPPQNKQGCCPQRGLAEDLVPPYNDGIRDIANAEAVTLVDVYEAFHGDNTTLIDFDGLHPTPAGYQVIADAFFKAIKQDLQVSSTSSFGRTPFQLAPMLVRPRRR